jgi:hypothetical protein
VQLAFWLPHREINLSAEARRRARITQQIEAAQRFIAAMVLAAANGEKFSPDGDAAYPCTWPGCHRGRDNPFTDTKALASHRFTAHHIRSANEDSIRRQERRDRQRASGKESSEYIDPPQIRVAIQTLLPIRLTATVRDGPLDPGEREQLRRRLCWLFTTMPKELGRTPAEIAIAAAQLIADGLRPPSLTSKTDRKEDLRMERLAQLFKVGTVSGLRDDSVAGGTA